MIYPPYARLPSVGQVWRIYPCHLPKDRTMLICWKRPILPPEARFLGKFGLKTMLERLNGLFGGKIIRLRFQG
jgi:hypothetical protein